MDALFFGSHRQKEKKEYISVSALTYAELVPILV
jgi:hypothetical protein